jgi:hypothetical protein
MSHGLMQQGANDDAKEIEETLIPLIGTCWFYIDSNGIQQGPFDLHKMREWNPRFFDGETLVRCGESSSSEFVPLRTTVIAQTLDDQAFSQGGFYAGAGASSGNDGSDDGVSVSTSSVGSMERTAAGPIGAAGAAGGANVSAKGAGATSSKALRGDPQSLKAHFESVERRAVDAEERAHVAEECMASAQRELAAAQERCVAAEKESKQLAAKLDSSTRTLREKSAVQQELQTRVESMNAELRRLQVFEVAFGMMKDGIDLIRGTTDGVQPGLSASNDSKSASPLPSSSSSSGKQSRSSGSRSSKKGRRSNNQAKVKGK